jgi:hypothetical protein
MNTERKTIGTPYCRQARKQKTVATNVSCIVNAALDVFMLRRL